jgi:hypothetical protein
MPAAFVAALLLVPAWSALHAKEEPAHLQDKDRPTITFVNHTKSLANISYAYADCMLMEPLGFDIQPSATRTARLDMMDNCINPGPVRSLTVGVQPENFPSIHPLVYLTFSVKSQEGGGRQGAVSYNYNSKIDFKKIYGFKVKCGGLNDCLDKWTDAGNGSVRIDITSTAAEAMMEMEQ